MSSLSLPFVILPKGFLGISFMISSLSGHLLSF